MTRMSPARLWTLAAASLLTLLAAGLLAACSGSPASGPQNTVDPGPLEPNGPISWSEASSRVGEVLSVQGPVTATSVEGNGDVVLNVGAAAADPGRFVVVIPGDAAAEFPPRPADRYDGQLIVATGMIIDQDGVATMVVRSPARLTTGQ